MRYPSKSQTRRSNKNVRVPDLPIDSRRAFVEHVCAVMIENRFPTFRRYHHAFQFTDDPSRPVEVFLTDRGCGLEPEYTCDTLGRELSMRIVDDAVRSFLARHKDNFTPEELAYGLARLEQYTGITHPEPRGSP